MKYFPSVRLLAITSLLLAVCVRIFGRRGAELNVWVLATGIIWLQVAGWTAREFWAGRRLLQDPKLTFGKWLVILLAPAVIFGAAFAATYNPSDPLRFAGLAVFAFTFVTARTLLERNPEIRERGMVFSGAFYPWRDIESHKWHPIDDNVAQLQLKCRGVTNYLRPQRLPFRTEAQAAVEAVLAQSNRKNFDRI